MLGVTMLYHGEVGIEYWEYVTSFMYIAFMYLYFARRKNMNIKLHPEFKYYMSGLGMKLFGGLIFSIIYFYYYNGGDTTAYFYSGVAMKGMLWIDPVEYFRQVFLGDNSERALATYMGLPQAPYRYVFGDGHTFQVVRLSSLLALLTFNSYLISTLIIASLSFFGVWAGYRTFVSYFPEISGQLAIAFLFMPSVIFWGSGIMKDTFTFSAFCAWVYAVDEVFFKRRNSFSRLLLMLFSAMVMLTVKPYIFMVALPATMLWLLYMKVVKINNAMIRFVLIPLMAVLMVTSSLFILMKLGDSLDKFALDEALMNIEIIQSDMAGNEAYGDNKFNVGEFDGTWMGVIEKFPVATNATLFRPYIWESRSAVIAMSGLENLFVLGLTIWVLLKAGIRFSLRCIMGNPLLLMAVTFSLLFAFVVGVSTANFGALVRFKIPMLPFYVSSLFIILYFNSEKNKAKRKGVRFDLTAYRMGPVATGAVTGNRDQAGKAQPRRGPARKSRRDHV